MFGDFSNSGDLYDVQRRIAVLNNTFGLLPAKVRDRFGNDPGAMLDFLADSKNDKEAVELGLKDKAAFEAAEAQRAKLEQARIEAERLAAEKAKATA